MIFLDQFPTSITQAMVDVKFEEYKVVVTVTDEAGT